MKTRKLLVTIILIVVASVVVGVASASSAEWRVNNERTSAHLAGRTTTPTLSSLEREADVTINRRLDSNGEPRTHAVVGRYTKNYQPTESDLSFLPLLSLLGFVVIALMLKHLSSSEV